MSNNYITFFNIFTFLSLFIICFVFLFKKQNEVLSFSVLFIFLSFFFLFTLQNIASGLDKPMYLLSIVTWFSILIGSIFNIVAVLLVLLMFYHLRQQYTIKYGKPVELPKKQSNMLQKFKAMLTTNILLILLLTAISIVGNNMINVPIYPLFSGFMNNKNVITTVPMLLSVALIFVDLYIVSSTSYEIYLSNLLYELKNITVIAAQ